MKLSSSKLHLNLWPEEFPSHHAVCCSGSRQWHLAAAGDTVATSGGGGEGAWTLWAQRLSKHPVTNPTVLGSTLKQAQVLLGGCAALPLPAALPAPHLSPLPRPICHLPPTLPQMTPQRAHVRVCACVRVCGNRTPNLVTSANYSNQHRGGRQRAAALAPTPAIYPGSETPVIPAPHHSCHQCTGPVGTQRAGGRCSSTFP